MSEMYKFHNPERIYFTSSTIIRRIDFLTLNEYQEIVVDSNQLNHVDDGSGGIGYYRVEVVIVGDYYPFGMGIVGRSYSLKDYRFGFNGKENDNEIEGKGSWQDYGMRIYDPRVGRFASVDPLTWKYPIFSPYVYVANNPINAIDPDGRYIIFIGGLRFWKVNADQQEIWGGFKIHKTDIYNYWSTDKNAFGRSANIASYYQNKYDDNNIGFTSGSSHWNSSAAQRMREGKLKGELFHKMVQEGDIKLAAGETIKIISHSQGGAHAAGYAKQLMSYKDTDGNPIYKVKVIEYITPHQPKDIIHPDGLLGIQYSHPGDTIASDAPWWLPNGGTEYGIINGIDKFFGGDIMGGKGQPPCGGAGENRCGHNVTDNDEVIKREKNETFRCFNYCTTYAVFL